MANVLEQRIGNTVSNVNFSYNSSLPVRNVPFKVLSPCNILPAWGAARCKSLLHATNKLKLRNANNSSGKGSLNSWVRQCEASERLPEGKPTNICFPTACCKQEGNLTLLTEFGSVIHQYFASNLNNFYFFKSLA